MMMRLAKHLPLPIIVCAILSSAVLSAQSDPSREFLQYDQMPDLPDALGVAGPFVGVDNDALIVAGGANFPVPIWENDKQWRDNIYVLQKTNENDATKYQWLNGGRLPRPIAYGASVSTEHGIVCIGGNDSEQTYDDVFLMQWDPTTKQIGIEPLPPLPEPCAFTTAACIGDTVYVASGQSGAGLETATNNFWALDMSDYANSEGKDQLAWKILPACPGPSRILSVTVAQHNGTTDCIYVMSGRRQDSGGNVELLKDVWEFNPNAQREQNPWRQREDVPHCIMAGPAVAIGQSHIFVLGGDDGEHFGLADELKDTHPGFFKNALAYHTITDTWITAGPLPANHVTTTAVKWDDVIVIATGEIRPRLRSPKIYQATPVSTAKSLGATSAQRIVNYTTIVLYLAAMIAIGVFFSFRNKNTDDFFRGGKRIPWWAAGLSIFATMLSSITYMAIPAKAYATDWIYLMINVMILAITPFVVCLILPFFRRIDATSAYEYLEKRFNVFLRLFASASFVLFQIGRMAIVMFLPALALHAITPFEVWHCIVLMGVLSIAYCTLGGFEAVIWTDSVQSIVLLGGAGLSLFLIILNLNGGIGEFVSIASAADKFHFANLEFGTMSFTTTALWVVVLGALGQNTVSYTSDQAVIQRYLSTSTQKKAAKAIWLNGIMAIPAGLLFFSMGTALFVFYKTNPEKLDPTFQTDAIFPLFIAQQLPAPIAGLVIAGIFAAAQSTISTSMNSTSTAIVTDFVRRFDLLATERAYLNCARALTLILGLLGTMLALLFASGDIKSLWDQFITVIGLFGGSMAGLFLLGIFTKRTTSTGAAIGAVVGVLTIYLVKTFTQTHLLLYATVGIVACFIAGYLTSLAFGKNSRSLTGLTIYTLDKNEKKL